MKVHVESILDCPVEMVWAEVLKSDRLQQVARPLVILEPVHASSLPETWQAQQMLSVKSYLFGLIGLGTRTLYFERIDHEQHRIQTRECDALVQRWDHLIAMDATGAGCTRYSDTVEISAGPWTWLVWVFAWFFYRHRQRRWQKCVQALWIPNLPLGETAAGLAVTPSPQPVHARTS